MPHPGLLHPEPLPLRQATDDPYLHKRHSNTQGRSGSVSVGSSGVHKVLFEPSERLWQVWSLILNTISPLLSSCQGFSFALGHGVSFFGGIQYSPVDGCSAASCNFGVLVGEDEHMSLILDTIPPKGVSQPVVNAQKLSQRNSTKTSATVLMTSWGWFSWFQDLMKLTFLTSHHRKNSVRDQVIGKKWIYPYPERSTLHRLSKKTSKCLDSRERLFLLLFSILLKSLFLKYYLEKSATDFKCAFSLQLHVNNFSTDPHL